jgi:hypothetical protein
MPLRREYKKENKRQLKNWGIFEEKNEKNLLFIGTYRKNEGKVCMLINKLKN